MSANGTTVTSVVLTGTYCSLNRGDAAMQSAFARGLQRAVPDCAVTICSPFPDVDRKFYDRITVVKSIRRNLPLAAAMLLFLLIGRFVGAQRLVAGMTSETRAIRDAALVVDTSGDMLTDDYGPHIALSHYMPLLFARLLKRPTLVAAQSVGPFRETRGLARIVFKGVTAVTLRESISRDHVERLGVSAARVSIVSDLSFTLEPEGTARTESIRGELSEKAAGRPFVGLSASNLIATKFTKRSRAEVLQLLADETARFTAHSGSFVVLFPHVFGPRISADDRVFLRELNVLMNGSAYLVDEPLSSGELKYLIGLCQLFAGARMHANMAALDSFVPTLALGYSHKSRGIMQQLGLERYVVSLDSVRESELCACLSDLWENRDHVEDQLRREIPKCRERAQVTIDEAARLLTSARAKR